MSRKTKLVAICGKSGSGKDTILKEILLSDSPHFHRVIQDTSRLSRSNEIEGIDYYFKEEERMLEDLLNNRYLDLNEFRGWFYGTPKKSYEKDILI